MFPRFSDSAVALWQSLLDGEILKSIWFSVKVLFYGYSLGMALAAVLVLWATASQISSDFLSTVMAMFNPLPAIALLPLAMLWFGLGTCKSCVCTRALRALGGLPEYP
jgi:NitT/TauT family transport system permease protein